MLIYCLLHELDLSNLVIQSLQEFYSKISFVCIQLRLAQNLQIQQNALLVKGLPRFRLDQFSQGTSLVLSFKGSLQHNVRQCLETTICFTDYLICLFFYKLYEFSLYLTSLVASCSLFPLSTNPIYCLCNFSPFFLVLIPYEVILWSPDHLDLFSQQY